MTEILEAAVCEGVKVPHSPLLNEKRIERINAARYEGQEIAGALKLVREGDRVLELGAGLGLVGAVVAKNRKPECVMSFEANPELIPHIEALYEMNGLKDVIGVTNQVLIAGDDRPESITFYLRNSYLGSSLIDSDARQTRPIEVPTADFDAVCDALRPNVLLIDIEGGEKDILDRIDLTRFRAIVIEFHPEAYGMETMRALKDRLRDAGFERDQDISTRTVWACSRAAEVQ